MKLVSPGGAVREAIAENEIRKRDLAAAAEAARRQTESERLRASYDRIARTPLDSDLAAYKDAIRIHLSKEAADVRHV